jgi:hypothetical protein
MKETYVFGNFKRNKMVGSPQFKMLRSMALTSVKHSEAIWKELYERMYIKKAIINSEI